MKKSAGSSAERQIFLSRRGEVLAPVTAYKDRVSFLPSLPATATLPSRTLGYNHALVEMVLQGRTFLEQFAKEHTRLVQQVRRLGLGQELGENAVDDALAGVAAGKNSSNPGPVHPVARQVAAAAGTPGALAVDATPPPPRNLPPSNVQTLEPSVVTKVNCVQETPPASAVNVAPTPETNGVVEEERRSYATVVSNTSLAATSSGTVTGPFGNMVPLTGRPMSRVVAPPATTVGVPGPSPRGEEPMLQEAADPSRGELPTVAPAPYLASPDSLAPPEMRVLARGLMSNLNEMVDMMLRGPLASLCQEEGAALCRSFTTSSSPK